MKKKEITRNLNFETLKNNILCPNIVSFDIKTYEKSCKSENCTCEENFINANLLDIFAHLYSLISTEKIKKYHSIKTTETEYIMKNKSFIFEIWNKKYKSIYDDLYHLDVDRDLLKDIAEDLQDCADINRFLVHIISWISVFDYHIGTLLNQEVGRRSMFPYKTSHGYIYNILHDPIRKNFDEFIYTKKNTNELVENTPHTNRNKITRNIFLGESTAINVEIRKLPYQYSEVIRNKPIEKISLSFVSTNLKLTDYNIQYTPIDEVNRYFHISSVNDKDYIKEMKDSLYKVNSDFILYPELLSELEFQKEIQLFLKERKLDNSLFLSGSFHVPARNFSPDASEEGIYNYAQVFLGDGTNISNVFKMDTFELLEDGGNLRTIEKIFVDEQEMILIDTPIGRIATIICVDLLNDDVEKVLVNYHVNIILVMAMTNNPASGNFKNQMITFGRKINSTVIICNNPASSLSNEKVVIYFPFKHYNLFKVESDDCIFNFTLEDIFNQLLES